jgi:hypothetical protein
LIQTNWFKTERQLDFLERIWVKLDADHQAIQSKILTQLVSKLEAAINELQKLEKKHKEGRIAENTKLSDYRKWKYPLIKKNLDIIIDEIHKWQQMFDPTWFLILRISDTMIDTELASSSSSSTTASLVEETGNAFMETARTVRDSLKPELEKQASIFLPSEGVSNTMRTAIPYSTASLFQRSSKNMTYILDSVPSSIGIDPAIQNQDVRYLARKLTGTDPLRFGLLQCRGVVRVLDSSKTITSFDFIFHIPPSLKSPQSLRNVLIEAKPNFSLSGRFHIAQQLAQSLSYVHTYGFVHKGIRPETVLIFQDDTSELAASFLLGFEKFRPAQPGRTLKASDSFWEKNLYRHPRRQGLRPEDEYVMQHDIYSLGVCLLEIGLWRTLVVYDKTDTENEEGPAPSPLLPSLTDSQENEFRKAIMLKDSLVAIAQRELPSRMGDKYASIVASCLTCLDESNSDFSDENEFKDEDDVVIGVRYIEKILLGLSSISV